MLPRLLSTVFGVKGVVQQFPKRKIFIDVHSTPERVDAKSRTCPICGEINKPKGPV